MPLRIVQWTTGLVGRSAVQAVLDHPDLELVGCYAWSADKVGQDVGDLCALGRKIGIAATNDLAAILALRPDCVLYMPLEWVVDDMVRLLEAGINVVSTANFITGKSYGEKDMLRLDEAARRGGVSLYGSGINPGLANVLGLVSTAVCRRVDRGLGPRVRRRDGLRLGPDLARHRLRVSAGFARSLREGAKSGCSSSSTPSR
jgi:hypothetical protein